MIHIPVFAFVLVMLWSAVVGAIIAWACWIHRWVETLSASMAVVREATSAVVIDLEKARRARDPQPPQWEADRS